MLRNCKAIQPAARAHAQRVTHMSFLSLGPSAGSYSPPILGLLSSSSKTGFTICFTETRRTSSVVRNEKEMLATVEGTG